METTKENLKRSVVEALKFSKNAKLLPVLEFKGIKFDEDRPMVLLGLDTCNSLSVGDSCVIERQILRYSDDFIPAFFPEVGIIAAFVELTGHLKYGRGIKIKDMFCILARPSNSILSPIEMTHVNQQDEAIIYLFNIGGLKKVEEK